MKPEISRRGKKKKEKMGHKRRQREEQNITEEAGGEFGKVWANDILQLIDISKKEN